MEERVHKDIADLFGKTNRLDKELVELKINQKHYTEALEKVAESNMKLVETLKGVEIAFVEIGGQLNEMSKGMSATNKKVCDIDDRMKKIEEDSRFEIMGFFKKYFLWIASGVGLLVYWLSKIIKF